MSDWRGDLKAAATVCTGVELLVQEKKRAPTADEVHAFLHAHGHTNVSLDEVKQSMRILGQFMQARKKGVMELAHIQTLYENTSSTFTGTAARIAQRKPPLAANVTKIFGQELNKKTEKPVVTSEKNILEELNATLREANEKPDMILTSFHRKMGFLQDALEGKGTGTFAKLFQDPAQHARGTEIWKKWRKLVEERSKRASGHFRKYAKRRKPRTH